MITRLIYSTGLKAFFPGNIGNSIGRSGNKSRLREPVNLEKIRQAMTATIRTTKLIRDHGFTLGNRRNITGNGLFPIWVSFRMYGDHDGYI